MSYHTSSVTRPSPSSGRIRVFIKQNKAYSLVIDIRGFYRHKVSILPTRDRARKCFTVLVINNSPNTVMVYYSEKKYSTFEYFCDVQAGTNCSLPICDNPYRVPTITTEYEASHSYPIATPSRSSPVSHHPSAPCPKPTRKVVETHVFLPPVVAPDFQPTQPIPFVPGYVPPPMPFISTTSSSSSFHAPPPSFSRAPPPSPYSSSTSSFHAPPPPSPYSSSSSSHAPSSSPSVFKQLFGPSFRPSDQRVSDHTVYF